MKGRIQEPPLLKVFYAPVPCGEVVREASALLDEHGDPVRPAEECGAIHPSKYVRCVGCEARRGGLLQRVGGDHRGFHRWLCGARLAIQEGAL